MSEVKFCGNITYQLLPLIYGLRIQSTTTWLPIARRHGEETRWGSVSGNELDDELVSLAENMQLPYRYSQGNWDVGLGDGGRLGLVTHILRFAILIEMEKVNNQGRREMYAI